MQTKAYMSALAGAIFLAGSRAHWRIPAILSGTLMMVLALSACSRSSAAPSEPVAGPPPAQGEIATAESALHTFSNPAASRSSTGILTLTGRWSIPTSRWRSAARC